MIKDHASLGEIIQALHDSEINGSVSWMFDGAWSVALGDELNKVRARATANSAQQAAEWLRATAVREYPGSRFATLFPDPITGADRGFV